MQSFALIIDVYSLLKVAETLTILIKRQKISTETDDNTESDVVDWL